MNQVASDKPLGSAGISSRAGAVFGQVEQVFDDVWWAYGTTRLGPGVVFPRTMTIIREPDGLVVIHPVLMPPPQQAQIEAIGVIKHIVRLGAFHSMDDFAYVERYAPTVWAPAGVDLHPGVVVHHQLEPGGQLPTKGSVLFSFERSRSPENALLLDRNGGLLVTCDSVQNWERTDGCSLLGALVSRFIGFRGRACIGPPWLKASSPDDGEGMAPDFKRLLALNFRHAIGGHGGPMLDTAKEDLRLQTRRVFGFVS